MSEQVIKFFYKNYRGETSIRTVIPQGIRYGSTSWHPTPGWLLTALDLDKNEVREFSLADCDFTKRLPGGEGER